MNSKTKSKKKTAVLIAVILLFIIAATAGILYFTGVFTPKSDGGEGVVGVITDDWDPGIEDTDGASKSGTQIPGYSSAAMNAGDLKLKISIGNPKENSVNMFATLQLSDGTVLYESELLHPRQGLTEVPLTKTLDKGEYDAMVVYRCVMQDEANTPLNSAESGFKLIVN